MTRYKRMWRTCVNPLCLETIDRYRLFNLCPSCQLMGRWAFALGAIVAGALSWYFK
jgi:hypothetical protein